MSSVPVRISEKTLRDLSLLKLAWKKRSYDEVIQELLKEHQLDKLKAIGRIEVAEQ